MHTKNRTALFVFLILMVVIAIYLFENSLSDKENSNQKDEINPSGLPSLQNKNNFHKPTEKNSSLTNKPIEAQKESKNENTNHIGIPVINKPVRYFKRAPYIKNLRKTLDNIHGDFNDLDPDLSFSIGRELDICSHTPRTIEAQEAYENAYYFAGGDEKNNDRKLFNKCKDITNNEIKMSYSLIKKAAINNNLEAIIELTTVRPPSFTSTLTKQFYEQTPEMKKVLQDYSDLMMPLLEKSASKGSIDAVFNLAIAYLGGAIVPRDIKKGLAYYMLSAAVEKDPLTLKLINSNIKRYASTLYPNDLEESRQMALKLKKQWDKLNYIID